jgi:hypothetical protein
VPIIVERFNMAENIDPTKTLLTAREKLIEERRALAVTIALGCRRRRTDDAQSNESRMAFINAQNLIEAIDRAIAHEELLMGEQPTSFLAPRSPTAPSATSELAALKIG